MEKPTHHAVNIKMPIDLYDKIVESAGANHRTVSGEIAFQLSTIFQNQELSDKQRTGRLRK